LTLPLVLDNDRGVITKDAVHLANRWIFSLSFLLFCFVGVLSLNFFADFNSLFPCVFSFLFVFSSLFFCLVVCLFVSFSFLFFSFSFIPLSSLYLSIFSFLGI